MLTQKELKELLKYNQETGAFVWIKSLCHKAKIDAIAGSNHIAGYISIGIKGKLYLAHRLAWLYVVGVWPENQIDHINHIRDDNRLVNLREATNQENHKNQRLSKNNTSGVTGVSWNKRRYKWEVKIKTDEKYKGLGFFKDKFEAICARKSAENKHGYHANHGR